MAQLVRTDNLATTLQVIYCCETRFHKLRAHPPSSEIFNTLDDTLRGESHEDVVTEVR